MCAIVDANVAHEVFGSSPQPAGERFFEWLERGSGRLVVGGKLLEELAASTEGFIRWASGAVASGRVRIVDEAKVDERTEDIRRAGACESDDPHILALAQISGARLLYSNDGDLQQDFKKKQLIDNPRGKVYSTRKSKKFTSTQQRLLADKNLCRAGR